MVLVPKKETQTWKNITKTKLNFDVDKCPCCKTGTMIRLQSFEANAPPLKLIAKLKQNSIA